METHGLNQPELAHRVRVGTSTVNRWLHDGRIPEGPILLAVAAVLEIDPWVLLGSDYVEPRPAREAPRVGRPPAAAKAKPSRITGEMMRGVVDEPQPEPDFETRLRPAVMRKRDRA